MTATIYGDRKAPSIKTILAADPCADGAAFLNKSKTVLRAWNTCKRADWLVWYLSKFDLWTDAEARTFVCDCVEHTLHFFEEERPDDNRPRLAIEAARRSITDHSEESTAARAAAWAAAWAAAGAAAWAAAGAAENEWQANRLRQIVHPFKKV